MNSENGCILVLAGNKWEFDEYMNSLHPDARDKYRYVTRPENAQGVVVKDVIWGGKFWLRSDAQYLWDLCTYRLRRE